MASFGFHCLQYVLPMLFMHGTNCENIERYPDLLLPYPAGRHGPTHHHRIVRETQPSNYGNETYEEYPGHKASTSDAEIMEHHTFVYSYEEYWQKTYVSGQHFVVSDPERTVSVLEPGGVGGCKGNTRATVRDTAKPENCLLAINAGFFNTTSGACLGDVVSNGHYAHSSGVQNAHFGIEKDGSLFFGYIPNDASIMDSFDQLVGGVIWLVRDGQNYIDVSKKAESSSSQETGTLQYFTDVDSARLAVGHDEEGRLVIVSIDGHTGERGISLNRFADLLIELGVVNAINLDGGGSMTVLMNDTLINYPGDRCNISNFLYSCERKVSTVICVHDIPCNPANCSNHGNCYRGECHCHGNWAGGGCNRLQCGARNCSGHGQCTEEGCQCDPGYEGPDCSDACRHGYYGQDCMHQCACVHSELCDHVDGHCYCLAGYYGYQCESECAYGTYGEQCMGVCDCPDRCSCDPVTGKCDASTVSSPTWQFGHCLADRIIVRKDLKTMDQEQYFFMMSLLIMMVLIAVGSIILNVILLSCGLPKRSRHRKAPNPKSRKERSKRSKLPLKANMVARSSDDDSTDSKGDADIESMFSNGVPRVKSIFKKLPFMATNRKQDQELWRNWKQKFRKKKRRPQTRKVVAFAAPPVHSSSEESKLLPCPHQNSNQAPKNERNSSINSTELLEEVSLQLSSPDHRPTSGTVARSKPSTNHGHMNNSSTLTSESFYGDTKPNSLLSTQESVF